MKRIMVAVVLYFTFSLGIFANNVAQAQYLNPDFAFGAKQVVEPATFRSQMLPFTLLGVEVLDSDGDGVKEVFILERNALHVFRFSNNELEPLGTYDLPRTERVLSLRSLSMEQEGPCLVINAIDDSNTPRSRIVRYKENTFSSVLQNIGYILNVVTMPPAYSPVLIGQRLQANGLFQGNIYEMKKEGESLVPDKEILLPKEANSLNFAYFPTGESGAGENKLIVMDKFEKLMVYSDKLKRLWTSEEGYPNGLVEIVQTSSLPGLGEEGYRESYFVPLRLIPLQSDNSDILVAKSIASTAESFASNLRFFAQFEILGMYWTGQDMSLAWKTNSRIKGAVGDFTVADIKDDGVSYLIYGTNTHLELAQANKSILVAIPLE